MYDTNYDKLRKTLRNITAGSESLLERFETEVEFAKALCKLQPSIQSSWPELIAQAEKLVVSALSCGKCESLPDVVRQAEETLAPIGEIAKQYTIHYVGHAHIDIAWTWSWPETVAIINDTFTTVLKLFDEFPDFCFSQSQAIIYKTIQKYNPELFEQIKRRVAEGRWEITAVHWVEGDKNLASGESLARHLLYTRRYMQEHFGLEPEDVCIDWEPDTFGHAITIPTIVGRGAVKRYYMCRGGQEVKKPSVFWWQGPDGSRILVYLGGPLTADPARWYNGPINPQDVKAMIGFCTETGLKDWMRVYGVGDHGGGPTHRDIRYCLEMGRWPIFPNTKLTTTDKYYSILEQNGDTFPVLDCELNFEWTGCYTSQTRIKKANRYGENQLVESETAAVLASRLAGCEYPTDMLRNAWTDILVGHFHDILPGSGVRATREYYLGLFQQAMATVGMIKTKSLRTIAKNVNTSITGIESNSGESVPPAQVSIAMGAGAGRGSHIGDISCVSYVGDEACAFVVFNPTTWSRDEVATVTIWDSGTDAKGGDIQNKSFVVHTTDGKMLPAQRISEGDYWGHDYVDLAFPVSVDAMGYKTYVVEEGCITDYEGEIKCSADFKLDYMKDKMRLTLENKYLIVDFDSDSGGVVKLVNKATGKDVIQHACPLGMLEYVVERPAPSSAWVIHDPKERVYPLEIVSVEQGMDGLHAASVVVKSKINNSIFTTTYTLKTSQPWLEIDVTGMWLERGGPEIGTPKLRIRFPLALTTPEARYEVPFGSIERGCNNGKEVPSLRWASVTGYLPDNTEAGLILANDSKYGHSLDGSTLNLTLIRSSYEPDPLPELGEHTIRMAVTPFSNTPPVADMIKFGAAFNHPLQVVGTGLHIGKLPSESGSVINCEPANVILSSVKKAEDEDALVFRLFETSGRDTSTEIILDPKIIGNISEVVELDLLERELPNSTAKIVETGFSVKVPANGITCVKVNFSKLSCNSIK